MNGLSSIEKAAIDKVYNTKINGKKIEPIFDKEIFIRLNQLSSDKIDIAKTTQPNEQKGLKGFINKLIEKFL